MQIGQIHHVICGLPGNASDILIGTISGGPGLQPIVLILWAVLIEEGVVSLVGMLRYNPPSLLLVGCPWMWRKQVLRDLRGLQRSCTPLWVVALRSSSVVVSSYRDTSQAQDSCTQPPSTR